MVETTQTESCLKVTVETLSGQKPSPNNDGVPIGLENASLMSGMEIDDVLEHNSMGLRQKMFDALFSYNTAEVALCIMGWYFFSLSISIYNKWMFGAGLDFHFPIFITAFHQICILLISGIVLYIVPRMRPPSMRMQWSNYARLIVPCSLTSAGDIGLSNVSFLFITLSLYTMVKTSSLIFVLVFGLLFRLEKFNWRLLLIVLIMTVSVIMMVSSPKHVPKNGNGATDLGVILVLSASMISGLRWTFTQLLLKRNQYTSNPFSTLFYISPGMSAILFAFGFVFEGWTQFVLAEIWAEKGVLTTIVLLTIPGFLAFMNTLCEFKLLKILKVVTLLVAGILKELITIVVSSLVFGDQLSTVNVTGLVLTFSTILWYNIYRINEEGTSLQDESIKSPNNDPLYSAVEQDYNEINEEFRTRN